MEKTLGEILAERAAATSPAVTPTAEPAPKSKQRTKPQAPTLIAGEMTLRELRLAMGKTQEQVAELTGQPQTSVSRIEDQRDMLVSSLHRIVAALGGQVRILVDLPDQEPVRLTGLG